MQSCLSLAVELTRYQFNQTLYGETEKAKCVASRFAFNSYSTYCHPHGQNTVPAHVKTAKTGENFVQEFDPLGDFPGHNVVRFWNSCTL